MAISQDPMNDPQVDFERTESKRRDDSKFCHKKNQPRLLWLVSINDEKIKMYLNRLFIFQTFYRIGDCGSYRFRANGQDCEQQGGHHHEGK